MNSSPTKIERLCELLVAQPGATVTHDRIRSVVYGDAVPREWKASVRCMISKLQVEVMDGNGRIVSEWGVGFRLKMDPGVRG